MSQEGRLYDAMHEALIGREVGQSGEREDGPLKDHPQAHEAVTLATDTALGFLSSTKNSSEDEFEPLWDYVRRSREAEDWEAEYDRLFVALQTIYRSATGWHRETARAALEGEDVRFIRFSQGGETT